jgi:peptidoglycan/xylan/chitin deacetylase (PgdA/CDA1 family)
MLSIIFLSCFYIANAQSSGLFLTLSFDDNLIEHYDAALMMERYGMSGTFYVNSGRLSTTSTYLRTAQVKELENRGHEIGGHTINHRNLLQSTDTIRRQQICDDKRNLEESGFNISSFAFPFGADFNGAQSIFESCGYKTARDSGGLQTPTSCDGCPTFLRLPLEEPFGIRSVSYRIDSGNQPIFSIIDTALRDTQSQNRFGWIILIFHEIGDLPNNPTSVRWELFESLLEYIQQKGSISVVNVNQLLDGNYRQLYIQNLIERPIQTTSNREDNAATSPSTSSSTSSSPSTSSSQSPSTSVSTSTLISTTSSTSTSTISPTTTPTPIEGGISSQVGGVVSVVVIIVVFLIIATLRVCSADCNIDCGELCEACFRPCCSRSESGGDFVVSNENIEMEVTEYINQQIGQPNLQEQFELSSVVVQ